MATARHIMVGDHAPLSKRKSDAEDSSNEESDYVPSPKPIAKKPRTSKGRSVPTKPVPHVAAKRLVQEIVANPDTFTLTDDTRPQMVALAKYAAALESGDTEGAFGTRIIKGKTEEETEELAEALRKKTRIRIKQVMLVSQVSWPSRTVL